MSNFRVTLFLNHFFSDHRASCRLYITSQIKNVQDLKDHIKEIFNLNDKNDFYLISNNLFLPNCEDIRVLKEDEVVTAIPKNSSNCWDICKKDALEVRKKRKLNENVELVEFNEDKDVNSITVKNEKKKKKKKKDKLENETNESLLSTPNVQDDNTEEEINKKILQKAKEAVLSSLGISLFDEENPEAEGLPSTYPLNRKFLSCKKTKEVKLMKISTEPKIVKTILVCDRKPLVENVTNSETSYVKPKIISSTPLKTIESNDIDNCNTKPSVTKSEIISSTPVNLDEKQHNLEMEKMEIVVNDDSTKLDSTTETTTTLKLTQQAPALNKPVTENNVRSTPSSVISDFSESIYTEDDNSDLVTPKRKRKRTRRKKPKPPAENAFISNSFVPSVRPLVIKSTDNKHIRFPDGGDDSKINVLKDQIEQNKTAPVKEDKEFIEKPQNGDVQTDEPVINVEETKNVLSASDYETLCTDQINQFPIMKDIFPKVGDIIAFKIYVLSQDYTPQISNYIIAQVLNYTPDDKTVVIRILAGNEHCIEPEGKFSLEFENDSVVQNNTHEGVKTFPWEALQEPRLLFP